MYTGAKHITNGKTRKLNSKLRCFALKCLRSEDKMPSSLYLTLVVRYFPDLFFSNPQSANRMLQPAETCLSILLLRLLIEWSGQELNGILLPGRDL
jgi:hypothetical protein